MFKFFCKHEWRVHEKVKREWDETVVVKGTESWINSKLEKVQFTETKEILICNKCGKIKALIY